MKVRDAFLQEVEAKVRFDDSGLPTDELDPDMSPPAFDPWLGGFYSRFWPEGWAEVREAVDSGRRDGSGERFKYGYRVLPESMRGDTLVSFNIVFKTRFAEGDAIPEGAAAGDVNPYLRSRKKAWLEGVSPLLIEHFRHQYHCLANFMPLPWGLNQWRGFACDTATGVANPGLCDFFDLFLDQVRKRYLGSDDLHPLAREELGRYRAYFDGFGAGAAGWEAYVRRNYLDGSFVDAEGRVNYLFDRGGGDEPATEELLAHAKPRSAQQTLEFVNNAFACWERRADRLAQAAGGIAERCVREMPGIQADSPFLCALVQANGAQVAWSLMKEDRGVFWRLAKHYERLADNGRVVPLDGIQSLDGIAARIEAAWAGERRFAAFCDEGEGVSRSTGMGGPRRDGNSPGMRHVRIMENMNVILEFDVDEELTHVENIVTYPINSLTRRVLHDDPDPSKVLLFLKDRVDMRSLHRFRPEMTFWESIELAHGKRPTDAISVLL